MANLRLKGNRLEYKVRDILRKDGYFVMRQSCSRSPDLVAIKLIDKVPEILFIECKWNKYNMSKNDKVELIGLAKSTGAKPCLAYNEKHIIKFTYL